jgi:hypothetical protein
VKQGVVLQSITAVIQQQQEATVLLRYNKSLFVDLTHVQQNFDSMNKAVELSEDDLKNMFQAFDKEEEEWINMFFLEQGDYCS